MVRVSVLAITGLLGLSAAGSPHGERFMDIPWGATVAQVRGTHALEWTTVRGAEEQFATDITEWDGVELRLCELEFTRGKFSGVVMMTRGRRSTTLLLARMTALLGSPSPNHTNPPEGEGPCGYQWLTDETHLTLDEDQEGNAYVYWYSRRYSSAGEKILRAGREK